MIIWRVVGGYSRTTRPVAPSFRCRRMASFTFMLLPILESSNLLHRSGTGDGSANNDPAFEFLEDFGEGSLVPFRHVLPALETFDAMLDGEAPELLLVVEDHDIAHDEAVGRREIARQHDAKPFHQFLALVHAGDAVSGEYLVHAPALGLDRDEPALDKVAELGLPQHPAQGVSCPPLALVGGHLKRLASANHHRGLTSLEDFLEAFFRGLDRVVYDAGAVGPALAHTINHFHRGAGDAGGVGSFPGPLVWLGQGEAVGVTRRPLPADLDPLAAGGAGAANDPAGCVIRGQGVGPNIIFDLHGGTPGAIIFDVGSSHRAREFDGVAAGDAFEIYGRHHAGPASSIGEEHSSLL